MYAHDADEVGFVLVPWGADEDAVVVDARAGWVGEDAGYPGFGFFDAGADASGAGFGEYYVLMGVGCRIDGKCRVGVVTHLHCVVSGSDQMRWKPSRWARSISSSFSRVVSIFGVLLGRTGAGVS